MLVMYEKRKLSSTPVVDRKDDEQIEMNSDRIYEQQAEQQAEWQVSKTDENRRMKRKSRIEYYDKKNEG